jgi:hypothetical protein
MPGVLCRARALPPLQTLLLRRGLATVDDHAPERQLSEALLPRGSMVGEAVVDPKRYFATENWRSAKGLFA